MPTYDTLIKKGTILDGLRTPRYVGDIGIKDGKIARIGRISDSEAHRVINAQDNIVCPGFVDLHTHFDGQIFWDPWCTINGWHGVTSVAIGNCGFGFAPVAAADRERAMLTMERNEAVKAETMAEGMPWDWETFPEYLDSVDRTPKGVNVLSYVPLNPLMMHVMGIEQAKKRPANDAERKEMCALLSEAMDVGGCGFSAQILGETTVQRDYDGTPMITDLMAEQDLVAFAEVLKEKGRGLIQILGGDMELNERLVEISGQPMLWNAVALATDQHGITFGGYKDLLDWGVTANKRGNRVYLHAVTAENNYQFQLADWNLFDTEPAWRDLTLGSIDEKIANMQDPVKRGAVKDLYNPKYTFLGAMTAGIHELKIGEVSCAENEQYIGFTIGEVAEREGRHPIDVMLDISIADRLETLFITPPQHMEMDKMSELANHPHTLPGLSDGGAHMKFLTMGRYPTEFLAKLVRENQVMDLETAHWKLSAYSAMAAGLKDRGYLSEGAPADIVVYDYDALNLKEPERLYDFPAGDWRLAQGATGYRQTMVNGTVTFEDGECTGETPGKLLRHGTA
ncbi:MAG: aminoacylase [Deltaproteobacteria bacterium]|nr:aminoacylase [Deltaproteobacteria bacterium]